MIIYFTRHGETEWHKKGFLQGQKNSPLTTRGKKSAKEKGKILSKENIEIIYSSDLGRCIQTSKIINKYLKTKIIKSSKLRERDFGDLNGKPNKDVRERIDLSDADEKAPNGESFNGLKRRIISFIKLLFKRKFQKILLVTHEGVLRAILSEYYLPKRAV